MTSPTPFNETSRQQALQSCGIVDTAPDPQYDEIVEVVCGLMGVPVALISLIDGDRQWFKARRGLDASETPRSLAFCGFAIMADDVFVVPDATADPRFANNPLVVGPPHIRFYAGAPLITREGFRLGTLCAIDTVPHDRPDPEKLNALQALAKTVAELMTLRGGDETAQARNAAAEVAKREFLALMSHELRTPLNAVIGFGELIAMTGADDTSRKYAEAIRDAGAHLLGLVNRILDFGQVDRGELTLAEEAVKLREASETAVTAMQGQARLAGVTVAVAGNSEDLSVWADPPQLHQMLLNLLNNALNARATIITVRTSLAPDGDILITVTDDGRGLEGQRNVTGAFVVGEDVMSRQGKGLGLGLPLTSRLVGLHGGSLSLHLGPEERGTIAELRLPAWRRLDAAEVIPSAG